ncbi:MAG: hypothetical protein WBI91_05395 [Coriobacteriia bacterium]
MRRVLELGSGLASTALFLDRAVFPELELLTTLEDDPEWRDVVLDAVGKDERLDFRMVDAVSTSVPSNLDSYDLIFVDDGRTPSERSATIRHVRRMCPRGVVAIHDFEEPAYRTAARGFCHRVVFGAYTPQVGVCWNDEVLDRSRIIEVQTLIERNAQIPTRDVAAWVEVLAPLDRSR